MFYSSPTKSTVFFISFFIQLDSETSVFHRYKTYFSLLHLCPWRRVFPKNYENLCPSHEIPSFGISCGYSIYMAKVVLEYFVLRLGTNCLESSFQRALPTKLNTNRGNAMILCRAVTDTIYFFLLSALPFFKFGNK
jgi:hypothetical protein